MKFETVCMMAVGGAIVAGFWAVYGADLEAPTANSAPLAPDPAPPPPSAVFTNLVATTEGKIVTKWLAIPAPRISPDGEINQMELGVVFSNFVAVLPWRNGSRACVLESTVVGFTERVAR